MKMSDFVWLFSNGLDKLKEELLAYDDENTMWIIEKNIKNSAGNLAQHLVGNLKNFVGKYMGQIPYLRERDREFNERQFDRATLLRLIDETKEAISKSLSDKDASSFLALPFPEEAVVIKAGQTNGFMLTYLYAHLNYHLGQVNYHRRLLN
ncbi:MAG: DUF1572 family protein [Taibaiella sp.]|jgi:hypothetical protein